VFSWNVGQNSQIIGEFSRTVGENSQRFGENSQKFQQFSQKIGEFSQITGENSWSLGQGSRTTWAEAAMTGRCADTGKSQWKPLQKCSVEAAPQLRSYKFQCFRPQAGLYITLRARFPMGFPSSFIGG